MTFIYHLHTQVNNSVMYQYASRFRGCQKMIFGLKILTYWNIPFDGLDVEEVATFEAVAGFDVHSATVSVHLAEASSVSAISATSATPSIQQIITSMNKQEMCPWDNDAPLIGTGHNFRQTARHTDVTINAPSPFFESQTSQNKTN